MNVQNRKSRVPASDIIITRVFAALALKYGHRWISQFPDEEVQNEAERTWAWELADMRNEQIIAGIDRCATEHPSWPPTVGEFKLLCEVGYNNPPLWEALPAPVDNRTQEERDKIWDLRMKQLKKALRGELDESELVDFQPPTGE